MKKCIFIIILIIINCTIFYTKIYSNELLNIKLSLKSNEIAIIIIKLDTSTSILLKSDDNYILYVLQYTDDKDFYTNIELFTSSIDYIFMTEEYDIKYSNKMVIDGTILLDNIRIDPNRIHYNNKTFCIDYTNNCDFVYLTNEIKFGDSHQVIFYDESLSLKYIEKLHDGWMDTYKVTKTHYMILIFGENYEVINLQHEY